MARIEGVDLPRNKPVWIALTYIYGIGQATARHVVFGLLLGGLANARTR